MSCKCGNSKCKGFVLLHPKETAIIPIIKERELRIDPGTTFVLKDSPSSGEFFVKFSELHVIGSKEKSENNDLEEKSADEFVLEFIADTSEGIKDGFDCSFIYLYGELEKLNKFNIVKTKREEDKKFLEDLKEKRVVDALVTINEKTYNASAFLWKISKNSELKGLIVLNTDSISFIDASKRYNFNRISF